MITPRQTRLVRVAGLHDFRRAIVALCAAPTSSAATSAAPTSAAALSASTTDTSADVLPSRLVVVPSRAAASMLAATFEAFTGEASKSDVPRPSTPPALAARFHAAIQAATDCATHPAPGVDQADSFYQVGATATLAALYVATVEGRTLGAFGDARRGVSAMEKARELAPGRKETGLVIGLSRYTIATLPWPLRTCRSMASCAILRPPPGRPSSNRRAASQANACADVS